MKIRAAILAGAGALSLGSEAVPAAEGDFTYSLVNYASLERPKAGQASVAGSRDDKAAVRLGGESQKFADVTEPGQKPKKPTAQKTKTEPVIIYGNGIARRSQPGTGWMPRTNSTKPSPR